MNNILNSNNKPVLAVLGSVAAIIFFLSVYIVWYGDAIGYKYSWYEGMPINSLSLLYANIISWPEQSLNGFTPNILIHLFVNVFGKFLFAVLNALMYVVLIVMLIRVSGGSRRSFGCEITMAILVLLACDYPYNVTSQISTVWVATISVYFIRLFNKYKYYDVTAQVWTLPLFVIYGLIAGCGNAYITYALAVALAIYAVRKHDVLQPAQVCLLVGFFIGAYLLFRGRQGEPNDFLLTVVNMVEYSRVTYVLIVVWIYAKTKRYKNMEKFYKHHSLIANAYFASLFISVLLGVNSPADLLGPEIFAASLTLTIMKNKSFTQPFIIAGTALMLLVFGVKVAMVHNHNVAYTDLKEQIASSDNGRVYVDLPAPGKWVHPVDGPTHTNPDMLKRHVYILLDDLEGKSLLKLRDLEETDECNKKDIVVLPTAIIDMVKEPVKNRIVYCPGDVYLLMQAKDDPHDFVINRDFGFLNMVIDHTEETIVFDDPRYDTRDYRVVVSSFLTPYTMTRDISIFE